MKKYLLLVFLPLFFIGCGNTSKTIFTISSQKVQITCDQEQWNCPDKKADSIKITQKAGGESNLIMEKITSEKSLEEIYEEKKSEVQKYTGNEITEEGGIENGKFFINKNTYSNNYLFRAVKKISDKTYIICSGYSPGKTFETVRVDFQSMCTNIIAS